MSLWRKLAEESAGWCGTSAERDIETVALRVKGEGESFLTISLPRYNKAFLNALETGRIDPNRFRGFHVRGGLPEFLRGFLGQIFGASGVLLDEPSVDCIRAVHLLTTVFGKIERQCSDARIARAMRGYVQVEQELAEFDESTMVELISAFRRASTLLWADVFAHVENSILDAHQLANDWLFPLPKGGGGSHKAAQQRPASRQQRDKTVDPMDVIIGIPNGSKTVRVDFSRRFRSAKNGQFDGCEVVDPATSHFALVPRHGPGATADRLRGNAKYSVGQWPRRLENVFPYGDYALPQLALENELDRVQFLEPGSEVPAKVTPVPKDDSKPRLIAEEPTAMQYMQQALFRQVIYRLENHSEFPPPLGGKEFDLGKWFIGFANQEDNRLLACEGSLNGSLATLDLSEASDRVRNSHALLLFERFPRLSAAVQGCRSTHADVQGHGVIPLTKFASMGSALCFPVEAMVFVTVVLCAIARSRGTSVNRRFLHDLRGKVRVYGDDIVVPVDSVQQVIHDLEAFGFKVNMDKSFWNGKFRESCGGDYYDGHWVTPVRLRHELPSTLADVDGVVGLVAFRNLLYWNGYWKTAEHLDERIRTLLKGRWPIVERTAAGLGRESVLPYKEEWLDAKLHDPRVSGAIVMHDIPDSSTSGSGALMKFLVKPGILPSQDRKHLERQGRPVASRIKLRGIRPY
jgi:hypothetical protein